MTTDREPNLLAQAEGLLSQKTIEPAKLSQQLVDLDQGAVADAAYDLLVDIHDQSRGHRNPVLAKLEQAHKALTTTLQDKRSYVGDEQSAQKAIKEKIATFGAVAIEIDKPKFTTFLRNSLLNRTG